MPESTQTQRRHTVTPPFIETGDAVYIVIGWDADGIKGLSVELRKLSAEEVRRYRQLRRETDIELFVNFISGG
jgi:hypothetical protein